ncbi:MAG TPA: hypothetical protein VF516_45425 [Kofleriaceae bacterium]
MDINKKNREYLRGRFKKNAIPTQDDFADFIEAAINLKDDGLVRPPGDALSVEASAAGAHPVLKLYDAQAAAAAWVVNLLTGDPAAGKKGLVISDNAGNSRLSIDQSTGELTTAALTAKGAVTAGGGLTIPATQTASVGAVTASGAITANGGLTIPATQTLTAQGAASIAGPLRMNKTVLGIGTPNGSLAAANEVVGAIGFYGYGRSNGQLSYRAGAGFELVDRSSDAPSLDYVVDGSRPYADLKVRTLTASDGVRVDGNRSTHLDVDGALYRTGSQVYLTVDDSLFVRRSAAAAVFQLDTTTGRLGVGKTSPACAVDVQGDIHATGALEVQGDIRTTGQLVAPGGISLGNDKFSLTMRPHATYVDPKTGQKVMYPVLHLKGVVLTSDVKARNAIACTRLDVNAVSGDASRAGAITCATLTASGDINAHGFNTGGTTTTGWLTATLGVNAPSVHADSVVTSGPVTAHGAMIATGTLDVVAAPADPTRPGAITCATLTASGDINAKGGITAGSVIKAPGVNATSVQAGSLQTDGQILASSRIVAMGGMIAIGTLDVNPVSGDPNRPGRITCGELATSGHKNFEIAHPLDPAHKTLSHASLEGPEAGVYYRGEAQLRDGRAVVTLPPYFEALTRKDGRTVMITPRCDGDDPISPLAATGITDGCFLVRAIDRQNLSQRFYWEVKAVRGDVAALEVERRKPMTEDPSNPVIP